MPPNVKSAASREVMPHGDWSSVVCVWLHIPSLPQVIANRYDTYTFTSKDSEKYPLNKTLWYIYGARDESGLFIAWLWAKSQLKSSSKNSLGAIWLHRYRF